MDQSNHPYLVRTYVRYDMIISSLTDISQATTKRIFFGMFFWLLPHPWWCGAPTMACFYVLPFKMYKEWEIRLSQTNKKQDRIVVVVVVVLPHIAQTTFNELHHHSGEIVLLQPSLEVTK